MGVCATRRTAGEISDDEVGAIRDDAFVGIGTVVGNEDFVAGALEGGTQHAGDLGFVIYDKNALQWASWVTMCKSTCGASDINFWIAR